jgi:hypothetical protein
MNLCPTKNAKQRRAATAYHRGCSLSIGVQDALIMLDGLYDLSLAVL